MSNLHVAYLKGYITKLAQVLGTTQSTGAGGQLQGAQSVNALPGDPIEEILAQGRQANPQGGDMVQALMTGQNNVAAKPKGKLPPTTPATTGSDPFGTGGVPY